ncbi:MAG TPA: hypothetical protein VGJ53_06845 [Micromonosporaceae bacterium]|jgi:hypothetical protein
MSKVVLDVSMSRDGFTAGPNVREAEPMGDGGERLHEWMAGNGPDGQIDLGVRREVDATVGATVIGRRTFDLGVGPWGGTPWPGIPSFVVTHRARQDLLGDNGGCLPSTACMLRSGAPSRLRSIRTSWCWARMSPGSCCEQSCSKRYESTSFRSC